MPSGCAKQNIRLRLPEKLNYYQSKLMCQWMHNSCNMISMDTVAKRLKNTCITDPLDGNEDDVCWKTYVELDSQTQIGSSDSDDVDCQCKFYYIIINIKSKNTIVNTVIKYVNYFEIFVHLQCSFMLLRNVGYKPSRKFKNIIVINRTINKESYNYVVENIFRNKISIPLNVYFVQL